MASDDVREASLQDLVPPPILVQPRVRCNRCLVLHHPAPTGRCPHCGY